MTKVILAIAMWQASFFGGETHLRDGGNEIQFYSIELINGSIAGIRQEQLNNKYPENMNHEVRVHVQFSYTRYIASMMIISPCDAASGLPTGKRQHKPVSSSGLPNGAVISGLNSNSTPGGGGYNELILDDTAVSER